MLRFGFKYHFGSALEKSFHQSIACPNCGSFKINRKGRAPFYERGFNCTECKEMFYVKLIQASSQAKMGKFDKFNGRLRDGTTDLGEF